MDAACANDPNLGKVGAASCTDTFSAVQVGSCGDAPSLGSVGADSCNGGGSTYGSCEGSNTLDAVGNNSCNAAFTLLDTPVGACSGNPSAFNVGDFSCDGSAACTGAAPGTVGIDSCNGDDACTNMSAAPVGNNSCNGGFDACANITGPVGNCQHNTVRVAPCAPPTITVPAPITVISPTAAGTTVTYTVTLGDPGGSGIASSGCSPATGSVFPVGMTTVHCSATTNAGASATATFTVLVQESVAGQINDLLGQVTPIGQSGLINDVRQIQADVAKNHVNAACGDLADFVGLVQSQTGKSLTTPQATQFTGEPTSIENALGC
jgi:hypothetical protein